MNDILIKIISDNSALVFFFLQVEIGHIHDKRECFILYNFL